MHLKRDRSVSESETITVLVDWDRERDEPTLNVWTDPGIIQVSRYNYNNRGWSEPTVVIGSGAFTSKQWLAIVKATTEAWEAAVQEGWLK